MERTTEKTGVFFSFAYVFVFSKLGKYYIRCSQFIVLGFFNVYIYDLKENRWRRGRERGTEALR